jgi:hypothetical protein
MKQLIVILSVFLLFSCNSDYKVVNTKIVKGRVSAIEEGYIGTRTSKLPKIYIQDNKQTITIDIPFANENDYKIGDSISVIIQQVEQFKKK